MIGGSITGNELVHSFRFPAGLKLTSVTYWQSLTNALTPLLFGVNALTHAANVTNAFLKFLGVINFPGMV